MFKYAEQATKKINAVSFTQVDIYPSQFQVLFFIQNSNKSIEEISQSLSGPSQLILLQLNNYKKIGSRDLYTDESDLKNWFNKLGNLSCQEMEKANSFFRTKKLYELQAYKGMRWLEVDKVLSRKDQLIKIIYSSKDVKLTLSLEDEICDFMLPRDKKRSQKITELSDVIASNFGGHVIYTFLQKIVSDGIEHLFHFYGCLTKNDSITFFDPLHGFVIFSGENYREKFIQWFKKETGDGALDYFLRDSQSDFIMGGENIKGFCMSYVEVASFDIPALLPGQCVPLRHYFCGWCDKKIEPVLKCDRCNQVHYCDQVCKTEHFFNNPWGHQGICLELQMQKSSPLILPDSPPALVNFKCVYCKCIIIGVQLKYVNPIDHSSFYSCNTLRCKSKANIHLLDLVMEKMKGNN